MSNVKQVYVIKHAVYAGIVPLANPIIEQDGCIKTAQFGDLYPADYCHSFEVAVALHKSAVQREIDKLTSRLHMYDDCKGMYCLTSGNAYDLLKDLK